MNTTSISPIKNNIENVVKRVVEMDMRLRILQILACIPSMTTNLNVLKKALQAFGHCSSSDLIKTQLFWLDEQGFIKIIHSEIMLFNLTDRGADIASGATKSIGVGF